MRTKKLATSHDDKLGRLVGNALDFLSKALRELETEPKYSLIHFYAAIELFLKARLLAEHWSLVVSKRQDADLAGFLEGDFHSVTLDEAANRLDRVVQSPLTQRELALFKSIGHHRNRIVHFFHDAVNTNAVTQLRQKVAGEQLKAWFVLNRLLRDRWYDIFKPWTSEISGIRHELRQNVEYLRATFDHMQPEIAEKQAQGVQFRSCISCSYLSAEVRHGAGDVSSQRCMVCDLMSHQVTVECPECGSEVTSDSGYGQCSSCGVKWEPKVLAEILNEDEPGTKDYFESGMPAHCTQCDGCQTVVRHGGKCVCANCLAIYEHEELHQCLYCSELNAGDMDESYLVGCVACEGASET